MIQESPQPVSEKRLTELTVPEKPQNVSTLTDYVTALMYNGWGSGGRTSTEIVEVARAHGIAMPMSTLSGVLNSLTKQGKLRRQREPNNPQWVYYPPLSVVSTRP